MAFDIILAYPKFEFCEGDRKRFSLTHVPRMQSAGIKTKKARICRPFPERSSLSKQTTRLSLRAEKYHAGPDRPEFPICPRVVLSAARSPAETADLELHREPFFPTGVPATIAIGWSKYPRGKKALRGHGTSKEVPTMEPGEASLVALALILGFGTMNRLIAIIAYLVRKRGE